MKVRLTVKQDNFCRVYVETSNQSEAYRQAYDCEGSLPLTIRKRACELMDKPKIVVRIAELRAGHARRHNMTMDTLTHELDEAIEVAKSIDQPASMVSAIMGKAKIHGFLTEDRPNERNPIKDASDEELDKRLAELEGE